jgi:ATP-dependent Clp protease protease subunit
MAMGRATRGDSIDRYHEWGLSVEARSINIFGEIDLELTSRTLTNIDILRKSGDQPIVIYLNSEGGDWEHGIAIYDVISALPHEVSIRVVGQAMSMASIILQAGDVREATRHSTIMIHDGTNSSETGAISFERWADHSRIIRKQMYDIYALRSSVMDSSKNAQYWRRRCTSDYIMTADQALSEGLLDVII